MRPPCLVLRRLPGQVAGLRLGTANHNVATGQLWHGLVAKLRHGQQGKHTLAPYINVAPAVAIARAKGSSGLQYANLGMPPAVKVARLATVTRLANGR